MTTEQSLDNTGEIITCAASESFGQWLATTGGSLAITTYQAGKVALPRSR